MSSIQTKIAEVVIQQANATENPLKSMIDGKTANEVCRLIFHSYRGNDETAKGLRLSDVGLNLLKSFFKCHNVKLPAGYSLKLPHLLYLDRVSKMPYWVNDEYLAVFDSELGMMLKLSDGNLQTLISTRFRLTADSDKIIKDM